MICDYEMLDSGAICLEVSVPSIGATFPSDRNFYSRQEGQIDFAAAGEQIRQDSEDLEERIARKSIFHFQIYYRSATV